MLRKLCGLAEPDSDEDIYGDGGRTAQQDVESAKRGSESESDGAGGPAGPDPALDALWDMYQRIQGNSAPPADRVSRLLLGVLWPPPCRVNAPTLSVLHG